MTFEEIIATFEEKDLSIDDVANMDYSILELGFIEEVTQVGGEDQGSIWYSIQHFKDHGIYIKFSGSYSSYEGVEFYGGFKKAAKEVKPVTKTIVVYE